MAQFKVTAAELRDAAKTLKTQVQAYESATKTAMQSATNLGSKWEGEAQKAFVTEQQKAQQWYNEMAKIVESYAAALEAAAVAYEAADAAAKAAIG